MAIRSNRVASRASLAASVALLLSACGTQQAVQKSEQSNQAYQERTTKALDRLTHTVKSGEPDYHVARPFVSGKPQPLAREVTLPRSLRKVDSLSSASSSCQVDFVRTNESKSE